MTTGKKNIIVIPARMDSKRLPGKPLIDVNGKPLLQWTYDKAKQVDADLVMVTSPDIEIEDYCKKHYMPFEPTSSSIPNGTIRCAQALMQHFGSNCDKIRRIINWQVDEPMLDITYARRLLAPLSNDIYTLVAIYHNMNGKGVHTTKVIVNESWNICHWFTRHPVPGADFHCGIYSFSWNTLVRILELEPTEKSKLESLEQLTWLEHQFIIIPIGIHQLPLAINTQDDLDLFRNATR